MSGLPKGPCAPTAWIGALLIAALLASGCGSGGETTSAVGTDRSGDREQPGDASRAQPTESGAAPQATARSGTPGSQNGNEHGAGGNSQDQHKQGGGAAVRTADRAAVKSCIARFGRAACKKMVKQAGETGTRIDEPSDCLKAMSRARCEELAAAQDAGKRGGSVNLEECIENPTPKCEAVLRPILEAQRGR